MKRCPSYRLHSTQVCPTSEPNHKGQEERDPDFGSEIQNVGDMEHFISCRGTSCDILLNDFGLRKHLLNG